MRFVGRSSQLAELDSWYKRVVNEGQGMMLAVRGRRQVGKSRLYTEFLRRANVPHVFFTAVKNGSAAVQLDTFHRDLRESVPPVPEAEALFASPPTGWADALGRLRLAAEKGPIVVVLDEFPWAAETDPTLEGALQNAWDRHLQHLPVLLVLVGSDVGMMERLTEHDRPLYGRALENQIRAFNPAEVAAALGSRTGAMKVFDTFLATGGYPKLVDDVVRAGSVSTYVTAGLSDENSNLIVVGQRSLSAEFPPDAQARRVLSAIGGIEVGHATFTSVVSRLPESPGTAGTALTRALHILSDQKQVVAVNTPAGRPAGTRLRRYRVTDPYLRFWFRFVEPHIANVARGRADLAIAAFERGWESWRGMAIEPEVHAAVSSLAPSIATLSGVTNVDAWWNRDHSVQVDLVASAGSTIAAIGSVKWRARGPFTGRDLEDLARARGVIPGAVTAGLVAVCPAGVRGAHLDVVLNADDLLGAWTP